MRLKRTGLFLSAMLRLLTNSAQAEPMGPGRVDIPLIAGQHYGAGCVVIHNNNGGLKIEIEMFNGWQMVELQVHAGWAENPVPMKNGNPVPGKFDFKYEYELAAAAKGETIFLDFEEDLEGFRWGEPYESQRLRHIAVHADVVQIGLNLDGEIVATAEEGAWAQGDIAFEGGEWGWWLKYPMTHKAQIGRASCRERV